MRICECFHQSDKIAIQKWLSQDENRIVSFCHSNFQIQVVPPQRHRCDTHRRLRLWGEVSVSRKNFPKIFQSWNPSPVWPFLCDGLRSHIRGDLVRVLSHLPNQPELSVWHNIHVRIHLYCHLRLIGFILWFNQWRRQWKWQWFWKRPVNQSWWVSSGTSLLWSWSSRSSNSATPTSQPMRTRWSDKSRKRKFCSSGFLTCGTGHLPRDDGHLLRQCLLLGVHPLHLHPGHRPSQLCPLLQPHHGGGRGWRGRKGGFTRRRRRRGKRWIG